MKINYDDYLEIMDKYININWNFRDIYKKMVYEIIEKHVRDNIQLSENNIDIDSSAASYHNAVENRKTISPIKRGLEEIKETKNNVNVCKSKNDIILR